MNPNPENIKIVEALTPATDAAGRTSDYVSLKNTVGPVIAVCHIDQGAADTILLTPVQATAVDGTGSTALVNNVQIWANLDCAASDTLARATDAKNYTTDAGVKHKIVVFQIDPSSLSDGFDCIGISTGASNAANLTQAVFQLNTRYAQATPPSAITD